MPPPARRSRLVLLSPHIDAHTSVREILRAPLWQVHTFFTGREGFAFLRKHDDISVVICENELPDGEWSHFLSQMEVLPAKPTFIVCLRLGDERLWVEALNLGAFDLLLAAPFEIEEVIRVTESAWIAWNKANGRSVIPRTNPSMDWPPAANQFKTRAAGCAST